VSAPARTITELMEYTARIHHEDSTYWAEIPELPGVFASGDTLDELLEGLQEAVALYLGDGEHAGAEISEFTLAVPA